VARAITPQDVAEYARRVGAHSAGRDDGTAHALEDQLYLAVLAAIAGGADRPQELAMAALTTRSYHFGRYT